MENGSGSFKDDAPFTLKVWVWWTIFMFLVEAGNSAYGWCTDDACGTCSSPNGDICNSFNVTRYNVTCGTSKCGPGSGGSSNDVPGGLELFDGSNLDNGGNAGGSGLNTGNRGGGGGAGYFGGGGGGGNSNGNCSGGGGGGGGSSFGNLGQELGQMFQEIQVPRKEFLPGKILIQIIFLDMVEVVKTD